MGLTEEFNDRGHNVERTGNTMLARGNVLTDDIEEAIFAGVTSRSEGRERTDVAQTWMRKAKRRAFPDDVDVCFTRADIVRVLLRTVDFGNDGLSVQKIAALRNEISDLMPFSSVVCCNPWFQEAQPCGRGPPSAPPEAPPWLPLKRLRPRRQKSDNRRWAVGVTEAAQTGSALPCAVHSGYRVEQKTEGSPPLRGRL